MWLSYFFVNEATVALKAVQYIFSPKLLLNIVQCILLKNFPRAILKNAWYQQHQCRHLVTCYKWKFSSHLQTWKSETQDGPTEPLCFLFLLLFLFLNRDHQISLCLSTFPSLPCGWIWSGHWDTDRNDEPLIYPSRYSSSLFSCHGDLGGSVWQRDMMGH